MPFGDRNLMFDSAAPAFPEAHGSPKSGSLSARCHHDAAGGPAHHVLFYASEAEYVDGVLAFLAPAVQRGDPILLAVSEAKAAILCGRLDGSGSEVEVLDIHELGRNPARIIPTMLSTLERHRGRRLHHVGEPVWPGRSPEEIQEAIRHETLINLAWPGSTLRVLCPYDTAELDPSVLRDAAATHPWVLRAGAMARNEDFGGSEFPDGIDNPLPQPPGDAAAMRFGLRDLGAVRALVTERATRAGLVGDRADDLVIAVNEVATNSIKHGRSDGLLRIWSTARELVCQLEDPGHITDPMAGRYRPVAGVNGGLGLWMVNQLCDLVQTRSTPRGTTVRLRTRLV